MSPNLKTPQPLIDDWESKTNAELSKLIDAYFLQNRLMGRRYNLSILGGCENINCPECTDQSKLCCRARLFSLTNY